MDTYVRYFRHVGDVGRYVVVSLLPESRLISRRSCEAQGCKQIQLPGSTGGERSSAQSLEKNDNDKITFNYN